jgi:hypothetical protein
MAQDNGGRPVRCCSTGPFSILATCTGAYTDEPCRAIPGPQDGAQLWHLRKAGRVPQLLLKLLHAYREGIYQWIGEGIVPLLPHDVLEQLQSGQEHSNSASGSRRNGHQLKSVAVFPHLAPQALHQVIVY